LRGVTIPVMVKNPINPDLALWVGALERLYKSGLRQLAAIHRGFSALGEQKYRNPPQWQLALNFKSQLPQIPLFFDPSHTAGKRAFIYSLSQKALNLNYDGLMIESHRSPDEAWSDAAQQVTPRELQNILQKLCIRQESTPDREDSSYLEELRSRIDALDREMIESLAMRMRLVEDIGLFKKSHNLAIFQRERWTEIFQTRPQWAKELGLEQEIVQKIFLLIHETSINIQTETFKKNDTSNPLLQKKAEG
ncbi:MAG: 3-deoxy-7-phosphoheptulonate synthase, partial [Bacteroidetes bacterium]